MDNYSKSVKILADFRRTRFLASAILSSPLIVFVYSPLLVALTVAGISAPFATGRFIDFIQLDEKNEHGLVSLVADAIKSEDQAHRARPSRRGQTRPFRAVSR